MCTISAYHYEQGVGMIQTIHYEPGLHQISLHAQICQIYLKEKSAKDAFFSSFTAIGAAMMTSLLVRWDKQSRTGLDLKPKRLAYAAGLTCFALCS